MGWGKRLRKAVKHVTKPIRKVVKPVEKVVKQAGKLVEKGVHEVGKGVEAVGKGVGNIVKPKAPVAPEAPAPQIIQPAPAPAALVEVPDKEDVETDDEAQTESGRKKARAGGKKSLSVARSSGGGLNI